MVIDIRLWTELNLSLSNSLISDYKGTLMDNRINARMLSDKNGFRGAAARIILIFLSGFFGLVQTESAQARPANFGQQWVRQNPFTIMGHAAGNSGGTAPYIIPFDPAQFRAAGLNSVSTISLNHVNDPVATTAAQAGIPWHAYPHNDPQLFDTLYGNAPGGSGVFWDEPLYGGINNFPQAIAAMQHYRDNYPNFLSYVDAQPNVGFPKAGYSYDAYLNTIVQSMKTDVLMFNRYPFRSNGTTDANGWFSNLMTIRNKALANNIPYWGFLQSYYGDSGIRTPSESDTRYNSFTLLTAGYTGVSYFLYDNWNQNFGGTFFDANGQKTAFYQYAAKANAEIANLGQSLRFLTSTDVRFLPGRNTASGSFHSTPTGLTNWSAGAGSDSHLLSASVNFAQSGNLGAGKDGLIGFFLGDDGDRYFMLSNLYHSASLSADAASLSFTLAFDSSVNSIWRLNRLTGLPEKIVLTNHTLTWVLPGGTGDLFKYDDGIFIGVPEPISASMAIIGLLFLGIIRGRQYLKL